MDENFLEWPTILLTCSGVRGSRDKVPEVDAVCGGGVEGRSVMADSEARRSVNIQICGVCRFGLSGCTTELIAFEREPKGHWLRFCYHDNER